MKKYKSSSEVLLELVQDKNLKKDPTYGDILEALDKRAFGIALLFFVLPSALPFSFIPGISFVFSIPIALFAIQMILGRKTLWLPKIISQRTISHQKFAKFIKAAVPYLKKIERWLKPRWGFMTSRVMEIVNGFMILVLALLLMLPIPLSNFILAVILLCFSLGLVEEDGVLIMFGYLGAITYFFVIYAVLLATLNFIF